MSINRNLSDTRRVSKKDSPRFLDAGRNACSVIVMKISKQDFKGAIQDIREDREPRTKAQRLIRARILAVAGMVLWQRRGVSEDQLFSPEVADLTDVVKEADARQLRILKYAAEDLIDVSSVSTSSEFH